MTTRSKIVTSMLAATVLAIGMATAGAASRPGSTPTHVTASRHVEAATAAKKLAEGLKSVVQGTITTGEMTRILHKYGL